MTPDRRAARGARFRTQSLPVPARVARDARVVVRPYAFP